MRHLVLFGLVFSVACQGVIEDPDNENETPGPGLVECSEDVEGPGDSPLSPLTRFEFNRSLQPLVPGTELRLTGSPGTGALDFDNDAADLALSESYISEIQRLGAKVATEVVESDQLRDCNTRECAEEFLRSFASKASRRPVQQNELSGLMRSYDVGAVTSHKRGVELAVTGVLTSAPFLYHVEVGIPDEGRRKLTGYEVASRLSYFLWAAAPDSELIDAAERGELDEAEGVARHAERMFADSRARESFQHLHGQWLHLERLDGEDRDPKFGVDFSLELRSDLKKETLLFMEALLFEDGTVRDIYDAPFSMMNQAVSEHSGVAGVSGEDFVRVELGSGEGSSARRGLLTQASFLASHSRYSFTSPILRGGFVRQQLLCQVLPPPPDAVEALPDPDEGETVRERLRRHRESTECSGCHTLMDPIGFAFEHFDATGRFRENDETGAVVDSSGSLNNVDGADTPITGAADLSRYLATSPEAQTCVATQYFRYALGRNRPSDICRVQSIVDTLGSDYRLRDLVIEIVKSESFRYRNNFETAACEGDQ